MEYKFEKERGKFKLYKGETGKDWSNHLFNGLSYVMSITHFGVPWSRYKDEKLLEYRRVSVAEKDQEILL